MWAAGEGPRVRPEDLVGLANPAMPAVPVTAAADDLGTADEGGPRHQPELSESSVYSPELEYPTSDLGLLDDEDLPPMLPSQLVPAIQRVARMAFLDPNDGIQL